MKYILFALPLFFTPPQDDTKSLIEKLDSDSVEAREEAARALIKQGPEALPSLRAAASGGRREVAARAKHIIRIIEIAQRLTPAFRKTFPGIESRLAANKPHLWTEAFLEATRREEKKRAYPSLFAKDLAPLASGAIGGTKDIHEFDEVCEALGAWGVKEAVPAILEGIKKYGRCTFPIAKVLVQLRDPAAVPVLLDYPDLTDHDVVGSMEPYLEKFGKAAYPEYRRRILGWRKELERGKSGGLGLCLSLLGAAGGEGIDQAQRDLLAYLMEQLTFPPTEKILEERLILPEALWQVAEDHPKEALRAIRKTVDDPRVYGPILFHSPDVPLEVAQPIVVRLWAELKERPNLNDRVREFTVRYVTRLAPKVLTTSKDAITTSVEAHEVLRSLWREADRRNVQQGLDRIDTFLLLNPDPGLQYSVAHFYFQLGKLERCESLLKSALPKLKRADFLIGGYFKRSEVRLMLGRPDEAEEDLEKAMDLKKANPTAGPVARDAMEKRKKLITGHPRDPKVRYYSGFPLPWRGRRPPYVSFYYREVAGGRAFYVGDKLALCAADPFKRETIVLGTLPVHIRDFMPLDGRRVFVALRDGTSALYEEGNEKERWKRAFSLGYKSYLTASPSAITAAEGDGTLHVLDPASGKTLWSKKVEGQPWRRTSKSERGNIAQGPERLIIPTRGNTIELVELATGKNIADFSPGFKVAHVISGKEAVFMAGADGEVAAFRFTDGARLWQSKVDDRADYAVLDISLALRSDEKELHLAIEDTVWSLGASDGKVLWNWKWKPAHDTFKLDPKSTRLWPVLRAAEDGLYMVVNWESTDKYRQRQVDIVFLSRNGKPEVHHTGPKTWLDGGYSAEDPFVVGRDLALYRGSWEIWKRRPKR